jgi:PmbA protein
MMEQLLAMAKKMGEKADVYSLDSRGDGVSFENAKLKDISSSIQSGISLRIMKQNMLGFAYTRNLRNREELVLNALDSLKGGVEASFALPVTNDLPSRETYDPSIETITNADMVEECIRVCDLLSRKTSGQINVSASRSVSRKKLVNSSGTNLSAEFSAYIFHAQIRFPYTSASVHRALAAKAFQKAPDEYLDHLAALYNASMKETIPDEQKIQVLFLPETVYVLMWRLLSATSGMSLYQNISPLANKIGEKIFDEKLSVYNNPLDDSLPGARVFDDEGTPCRHFPLIEKGILKHFYYDLFFAEKLRALPTGSGFRGAVSSKPAPVLSHLTVSPGEKSFSELIASIDCGIIVAGALGAHSGNIPNGDFSIGVSPALYIRHGEIAGHVKDVMIAGNIYEVLKNIVEKEDTLHPGSGGNFPSILLDNVHITVKK